MDFEEVLKVLDNAVFVRTQRRFRDVEWYVLWGAYRNQTYDEMAKASKYRYSPSYLKQTVGPKLWELLSSVLGEKVSKTNFRAALERYVQSNEVLHTQESAKTPFVAEKQVVNNNRQDWGEAIDVDLFYGRTEELATLEQWIVRDCCRVVALLGMGGIGKTSLAIRCAKQIQDEFDYIIWRSLRNAPPIKDILATLSQFLSNQQEIDSSKDIDDAVSRLIAYLRSSRCLLILDNVEMILLSGGCAGHYREGYEAYGEFLRRVGEECHQSCLLLTSREDPKELGLLEGDTLPVRSLRLTGLKAAEGQEIFRRKGSFSGSESEWKLLIEHYAGNPLALKMVAAAIQDLLDSSVSKFLDFLRQGTLVFDDIRALLDRQFNRLSDLEREIMYWLAIEREPIALAQLQENILSSTSRRKLPEALRSLGRRSLIEKSATGFTQQPVVMEYMSEQLIEQVCEEIATEAVGLLMSHALIKAQAKDYIQASQVRVILKPIADRLHTTSGHKQAIEQKLRKTLCRLREEFSTSPGYGGGNIINLLCQLKTNLTGYDFSELAVWQADLRNVNLHSVNFAYSNLAQSVFAETLGSILSVTFSPDSKFLATGDTNGEVCLWQVEDGKKLSTYTGHTSWVRSISFSSDGHTLASGSYDQTVRLWNVQTGQCLKTLQEHISWVYSVSFSPDGHTLASGSGDHTVKLWDVSTGQCLKVLQEHTSRVWSVSFSPNGHILASGSNDYTVRLWDISTGECLKVLQEHASRVYSVSFSPDGSTLAISSEDQTVRLWDVHTGQCLKVLQGYSGLVWSISFSPDGHILASGGEDQTVRLWDVHTGQYLKVLQGHTGKVWSISFSPDGHTLASGGEDQTVRLWDVHTGQCLKVLQGHTGKVWSISFSPDGHTLASGGEYLTARLWNLQTDQCLKVLQGHTGRISSISLSPDGHTLASGSDDKTVRLWDVHTGQCFKVLQGHLSLVYSVSFSPDGYIIASGSEDHTVRLWDVHTGQCLKILQENTDRIWSVAFSSDGRTLASGSEDRTVRLWDVHTGQCLKALEGHTDRVYTVSFSPDSHTLASGSCDYTIKLWDVRTGQYLRTLQGHTSWVISVGFSPDGQTLASSGEDQTVRLWDITTGQCVKVLQGHTGRIHSVSFSPDGHTLASGSGDETIKQWDVKTGECLKTLQAPKPYEKMNITGITGLTQAQTTTLKALGAVEL